MVRERAAELAPRIVEAFGDAFAGDNSRDALKGLISVLANEILTFTGCVNEEVWHPVSLWIRLINYANVQHPLQHAGGNISLLSRCEEHGLAAAFPDNWANGPMYWSADADEEFANRTSLATLRDRWISQLHDLQANGGYSWPWLAESFDLHHVGSGVRHQYQKCSNAASWEEIEEFWDYSNGDRYFLDLEFDKDWALHQFTEKVYQQCRPIGL